MVVVVSRPLSELPEPGFEPGFNPGLNPDSIRVGIQVQNTGQTQVPKPGFPGWLLLPPLGKAYGKLDQ